MTRSGFSRAVCWLLLLALWPLASLAGQARGQHWYLVSFTDKLGSAGRLSQPEALLAPEALKRRRARQIPLDSLDLPVSEIYLDSLRRLGAQIWHTSRWLNATTVRMSPALAESFPQLTFVDSIAWLAPPSVRPDRPLPSSPSSRVRLEPIDSTIYGGAGPAIRRLRGDSLHRMGYRGEGMRIAVLDGGFEHLYGSPLFSSMLAEGRLTAAYDFVRNDTIVDRFSDHGTKVLALLASRVPGHFVGAAPQASYLLLRTERMESEYRLEECHWIAGLERADSLGVDVVNASLSYRRFDHPDQHYRREDLDGQTAWCSRAANIALDKGMLVVTSAGNRFWPDARFVGTPADSPGALTVGAINPKGRLARFSAHGPTADGRLKPDLLAPGHRLWVPELVLGDLRRESGTSYSAPLIAGLAACLWQAFPDQPPRVIARALRQTATLAAQPDQKRGRGTANLAAAYRYLAARLSR